jgi:ankyrin repeat protein
MNSSSSSTSPLAYYTNYAWCARIEGYSTIHKLLEYGAKPNNRQRNNDSDDCKSALLWALFSGGNTAAVVELLLESGADPKECDHLGKDAMDYAKQMKRQELVDLVTRYYT